MVTLVPEKRVEAGALHPVSSARRKRVVLLGATGSIGENTLRVLRAHPDALELVAVAANGNADKLLAIAREFGVRHIALFEERAAAAVRAAGPGALPAGAMLYAPGIEGLEALATLPEADVVLVAVVGTAGLRPALAALAAGKDLALASKEILVLAGAHVLAAAKKSGARLLPVDSEHNAVFQCLQGHRHDEIRRVILTASGGAFRDWPVERLGEATVADALKHPNWAMGPKITVDSATLANKGLELIEASVLFDLRPAQCAAIIHPQSIVHCLVEYTDGAMLAQLCPPSMTFPIQHALLHPARGAKGTDAALPLDRVLSLEFRPADEGRFPMLRLAREAMERGGAAPAVYNAANEVAVAAFLAGKLPFLGISRVTEATLAALAAASVADLTAVLAIDAEARAVAGRQIH
jgi:1-deoxy-D-xylulose-5-phosphate reductoisomerase